MKRLLPSFGQAPTDDDEGPVLEVGVAAQIGPKHARAGEPGVVEELVAADQLR